MRMTIGRLSRVAVVAVVVALFSAPVGMVQAALVWQTEMVDTMGDVGHESSLALDADGHPHISYWDGTNRALKYAAFDGTDWQIETVSGEEEDVGLYSSLALDSDGHPRIIYSGDGVLKYAAFDGTAWQIHLVDSTGPTFVGRDNALALDSDGQPHISYYDHGNHTLKYAAFDGTDWQIETVDTEGSVGYYSSLVLDSQDQPHISCGGNGDLKYAAFDGAAWQIETVHVGGGGTSSLALDSQEQPHISYLGYIPDDYGLMYAHFTPNEPPSVDAGRPYSGAEGSPITLDGGASDPESDELTTEWSYEPDSADPVPPAPSMTRVRWIPPSAAPVVAPSPSP